MFRSVVYDLQMIILGVDPGSRTTGYGVVAAGENRVTCLEFGTVSLPSEVRKGPIQYRLAAIFHELDQLLERHRPDRVAVEGIFYATNAKSALMLGHVRGVVLLAACLRGIPVAEFSPLEVKKSVAGYGRAEKSQVQHMVKTLLNLKCVPKPYDASDALAIALCCFFNGDRQQHSRRRWRSSDINRLSSS